MCKHRHIYPKKLCELSLALHEELAYHSLSLLNKIFYELALKALLKLPLIIFEIINRRKCPIMKYPTFLFSSLQFAERFVNIFLPPIRLLDDLEFCTTSVYTTKYDLISK
jgi:hypothetical protein